jgi:GNAT superfamily N-acetyltransferase
MDKLPPLSNIVKEVLGPDYWYDQGNAFMGNLMTFERSLKQKYPELEELHLSGKPDRPVSIHSIRVKSEHQGEGIGTKVLNDVKEYASKHKIPVILTPEADRGKKEKLAQFYKNNGFTKCKDSRYTSMFGPVLMWSPK